MVNLRKLFTFARLSTLTALFALFTSTAIASPLCYEPGWFGSMGLTGYHYKYKERKLNNHFLMQDDGPLYGFYYGLGYQPEITDLRFAVDGYFSWGNNIHYKSERTGESKNEQYSVAEIRLLGFYPWRIQNDLTIEGYTGWGGRMLDNDGNSTVTTTGHVGYLRESTYSYIPIGARIITALNCDMYLIGHLEYDWFLSGTQESYIDGVIRNHQDSGCGVRAGIDLQIPTGYQNLDVSLGTFVRYWSIKDSTVNTSTGGRRIGYEPRNRTCEIGINVGLVF